MEIKKAVEEWETWDEKEKAAKSKEKVKKLVTQRLYKWIYVFGKKTSERMLMRKIQNYIIDVKKGFVLRKRKIYPLSREERGEICKFIEEQLRLDSQSYLKQHLYFCRKERQ